jgi:hypothetical protein
VVGKGGAPLQCMLKVYLRSIWSDIESVRCTKNTIRRSLHFYTTSRTVHYYVSDYLIIQPQMFLPVLLLCYTPTSRPHVTLRIGRQKKEDRLRRRFNFSQDPARHAI